MRSVTSKSISLSVPIWISVFAFATVHETTLIAMTLLLVVLSIWILRRHQKKLPDFLFLSIICVFSGFLLLIVPLPVGIRSMLLGEQSTQSAMGLAVAEATWQPLAYRPRMALTKFGFYIACAMYAWACGSLFSQTRRFKDCAKQIVYCATALCLIAWLHSLLEAPSIYWISNIPSYRREYFFGSFVNPNHAGAFLAAAIPMALAMRGNKKYAFALILGMGLWQTQSRGAVIAGMLGAAIYSFFVFRRHTRWVLIFIVASILAAAFQMDFIEAQKTSFEIRHLDDWSSERIDIWGDGLQALRNTPLLGVGPDGFVDIYSSVKSNPRFTLTHHAHQEPLEILINHGWLLGSIILFWWGWLLQSGIRHLLDKEKLRHIRWRAAAISAFAALTIASTVDFPLQIGANLILFSCISGILLNLSQRATQTTPIYIATALVGFSILLLIVSPTSSPYGNLADQLQRGERLRVQKQYEQSLSAFQNAIRNAPMSSRPLRQYALTLRFTDLPKAIEYAEHSTKMSPENSLTWMTLAELNILSGKRIAGLKAWNECLGRDLPNNDQGTPYFKQAIKTASNLAEALRYLQPTREDRILQLSQALSEREAFTEMEKLLSPLQSSNEQARLLLAEMYLQQKKADKAWEIMQNFQLRNCRIAKTSAKALLHSHQTKKAIRHYRVAIDFCGPTPGLSRTLLYAQLMEGEEKAIQEASHTLAKNPQEEPMRKLLLHALALQLRYKEMIPHLEFLQQQGTITPAEREDLRRIRNQRPPKTYPKEKRKPSINPEKTPKK